MLTSNHPIESIPSAGSRQPLRLLLSEPLGHGAPDGAWWPQSRDLRTELADLVAHFPPTAGRIIHAVYSRPDWQPAPRHIKVPGGVVEVGCYPGDDARRISLGMASFHTLQLIVIAPDVLTKVALRAMRAASGSPNRMSASSNVESAQPWEAAESQRAQAAARWDDDGGEWSESHSLLRSRSARR